MILPDGRPAIDAEQLTAWADELRSMAALGLLYTQDAYDRQRFERIRGIAEDMLGGLSTLSSDVVRARLASEIGYVTVKVGVAAAIVDALGRMLLIQRRDNGLWAMPGGWADVGETPSAMMVREVWEETGLTVKVTRLLGLYDSRVRRFGNAHHLYHLVFLCLPLEGEPVVTAETRGVGWYAEDSLPPFSPGHEDAVHDAFRAWADPHRPPTFD